MGSPADRMTRQALDRAGDVDLTGAMALAPDGRRIDIVVQWRIVECGYRMVAGIRLGTGLWDHVSRIFDEPPTREQVQEFAAYVAQMKLSDRLA